MPEDLVGVEPAFPSRNQEGVWWVGGGRRAPRPVGARAAPRSYFSRLPFRLMSAPCARLLFLDEVAELAPDAQAMLLRFLGEGEVRAVGASRAGHVDVRLGAATHRDLCAAVAAGGFREDLYYRLRGVVLTLPPLRQRLEDLPLLVEHVRRRFNLRHGLAIDGVTDEALRRLAAYPWPGTVRELDAGVTEAMLLQSRGWLRAEDFTLPSPEGDAARANASLGSIPATETRRQRALKLAARPTGVSTSELARAAGVGLTLARGELAELAAAGALRRTGTGRAVRYIRP